MPDGRPSPVALGTTVLFSLRPPRSHRAQGAFGWGLDECRVLSDARDYARAMRQNGMPEFDQVRLAASPGDEPQGACWAQLRRSVRWS